MLILCVVINFFRLTGRHVPTLTANSIINNMYYGEFKSYATSDILWDFFRWSECNGYWHKQIKMSLGRFSWSIKIKVNGDNIIIFCTMVAYKLKVMHDEYDTLHFFPIIQNINYHPRRKTTVVIITLCFFQMTGTWVILSLMRIQTAAAIQFLKACIQSSHPYTLVIQNTGYT